MKSLDGVDHQFPEPKPRGTFVVEFHQRGESTHRYGIIYQPNWRSDLDIGDTDYARVVQVLRVRDTTRLEAVQRGLNDAGLTAPFFPEPVDGKAPKMSLDYFVRFAEQNVPSLRTA